MFIWSMRKILACLQISFLLFQRRWSLPWISTRTVYLSPAPDLPPLRLRKTGSTNWSFLPKVFFNNFHSRSLVKSVLFRRELMRRVLSDNIWRQEDYYGKMSQVHHLPQMKSPLLGLRLPSSQLRGSPGWKDLNWSTKLPPPFLPSLGVTLYMPGIHGA